MHGEHDGAVEVLPRSLGKLRARFADLPAPPPGGVTGTYRAVFVGPAFLRIVAPRAIALAGMSRWYGKRFDGGGGGVNLLRNDDGSLRETLPTNASVEASWLDGRDALVVSYRVDSAGNPRQESSPVPWRWVRDEFRVLGDGALLGLTFAVGPWSRVLASPFVLVRVDPAT